MCDLGVPQAFLGCCVRMVQGGMHDPSLLEERETGVGAAPWLPQRWVVVTA